jgi:hypothetical protein
MCRIVGKTVVKIVNGVDVVAGLVAGERQVNSIDWKRGGRRADSNSLDDNIMIVSQTVATVLLAVANIVKTGPWSSTTRRLVEVAEPLELDQANDPRREGCALSARSSRRWAGSARSSSPRTPTRRTYPSWKAARYVQPHGERDRRRRGC